MKKLYLTLISILGLFAFTFGQTTLFDEDVSFFTALSPSTEGDVTTDATTWDIVDSSVNPFSGNGLYIKDTTTDSNARLQGNLGAEINGPVQLSFDFQQVAADGSSRAVKIRLGNEFATGGDLGSESRSAASIEIRQDGDFRIKGDQFDATTTVVTGTSYEVDIVANFSSTDSYSYSLHGEDRTIEPFRWDVFIDGVIVSPAAGGFDFVTSDWATVYNNAGLQSIGIITDTSNTGGEVVFDNMVLTDLSQEEPEPVEGTVLFDENVDFFTNLDPSTEGDYTVDATTWDVVDDSVNPFSGNGIYVKDTTTDSNVELEGDIAEAISGPLKLSFDFQQMVADGSSRAVKVRIGNETATGGGLGSGSRSAVTVEIRQDGDIRWKGDTVDGTSTFSTGTSYSVEIVANFSPTDTYTYTLHGTERTLDPFSWDAFIDGVLTGSNLSGYDFTNADWATAYSNAGAQSFGIVTDTSNTGGEVIIDNLVLVDLAEEEPEPLEGTVIFDENVDFFSNFDPSTEGDYTTDATTWDIVDDSVNPFSGNGIYVKDTTLDSNVELEGDIAAEINGPLQLSFDFQQVAADGGDRAVKVRIGNETATGGGLGSGSRSAVSLEIRQNGELRWKGDTISGTTPFVTGTSYSVDIVANFSATDTFTYTLHGQERTLDPFSWDAYVDGALQGSNLGGFDFSNSDWGNAYNNAGAQSFGIVTDTSNTGGEVIFDNMVLVTEFSTEQEVFSETVDFFTDRDPADEGDYTTDATTWDIVDETVNPFGTGNGLYIKDTTTDSDVSLQGNVAEEVNAPVYFAFKFQQESADGSSRAVKIRAGNSVATGGDLGSESRSAVSIEIRQNNVFRLKGDVNDTEAVIQTGVPYEVEVVANFSTEPYTYSLNGSDRTIDPFHWDAYLDGVLLSTVPEGIDFVSSSWATTYAEAGFRSLGIVTDTSNTGGEVVIDDFVLDTQFAGEEDDGGEEPREIETYFENDFEADTVGEQPEGAYIFSPSTNDTTNGAVIIDGTSDPVNPLSSGQSLYVYDLSGDLTVGNPTHMRWNFANNANTDNVRVDLDFQRTFSAPAEDEETRVHIGIGRAGDSLNNSDFRPFELRILNNGDLVVNYNVDDERSSSTVASYDTANDNALTFFANSHDVLSYDYDDAELGTGIVPPNHMHLFLNGTFIGEYLFLNTPDPANAPQVKFFESNEDLGQLALYQDSKRQGGVVFDNITIANFDTEGVFIADKIIDEAFDYVDGPLRDAADWTDSDSTTGDAAENTDAIQVVSGAVEIDMNPVVAEGNIITPFLDAAASEGTYYAGMDITVSELPDPANGTVDPWYFFGFTNATGTGIRARTWVFDQDFANDRFKFGITVDSGSRDDVVTTGWLAAGTTYRVVVGYDWNAANGNVMLWVNPIDALSPMVETTAETSLGIQSITLRQDDRLAGKLTIDNLSLGDAIEAGLGENNVTVASADPSGLAAAADGPGTISLSWVDNSSDEIGFVIQRLNSDSEFETIGSVIADETTFSDTGLDDGTEYTYQVLAFNGILSGASASASATTDAILTPVFTVQPGSSSVPSGSSVDLAVAASSPTTVSYQWYEGLSGDDSNPVSGATSETFTSPNLTADTNYWVRATNDEGSTDSQTAAITVFEPRTINILSISQFNALIPDALPGDTYVIQEGTYQDVAIEFEAVGTENAPITLKAERPGRVFFTGDSHIELGGEWLVVDGLVFTDGWNQSNDTVIEFRTGSLTAHNSRVTNVAIVDYSPADSTIDRDWVGIYGTNNRVDHCYFSGHSNKGVTMVVWHNGLPNDHRIDHNHFAFRASGGGENGWETLRVGTSQVSLSVSRTIVEYNLFEECNGEIEIISNKSEENVYRYNTFYRCDGMLTLRHGNRCVVEGNYFIGEFVNGSGGIRVIGEDHVIINNYITETTGRDGAAITVYAGVPDSPLNEYFAANNSLVAFNTIVDVVGPYFSIGAGFGGRDRTVLPTGVVVANNILDAGSRTSGSFLTGESVADPTYEGNFAFGRSLGATVNGFAMTDPMLVMDDLSIMRPDSSSPVIGAATGTYSEVELDLDGQVRDGNKDVGADEVSTAGGLNVGGPIGVTETGPAWIGDGRVLYQPVPANYYLGATEIDSITLSLDWFGTFDVGFFPWVHHETLGWIYASGPGNGTYLYYVWNLGWTYVSENQFPLMYDYSNARWLYYYNANTGNLRYFYDYKAKQWISVEK